MEAVAECLGQRKMGFGPQDISEHLDGAFTGEVSAQHAKSMGATHILIGHSERRKYHWEEDKNIQKKIKLAEQLEMTPLVCLGESFDEREAGKTISVITEQVQGALDGWKPNSNLILAYEPVWAIGTGKVATPEQAAEAHQILRQELHNMCDDDVAKEISILYGGSVKPDNAEELIAQPNIDGFLVGGAILKPNEFFQIGAKVFGSENVM